MRINSTLAEIASDVRHAVRFDDFEPQQIEFLNSIAERIEAAGTRSFPLSHWAFEEIAPGELRVTFPDLVSTVVRQSAGDRGEPIEFALYMLASSLLRCDVFTRSRPADGDFVMVPREPTQAMVDAGMDADTNCIDVYAAMLSATPQQHEEEVGDDWYTSAATGAHVIDWDENPNRQLSLMLSRDGKVRYAALIDGKRITGADAKSNHFIETVKRWAGVSPQQPTEAVAWRSPDEAPTVPAGGMDFFWVAVRRKHNGKVYSFPAAYLNSMSLDNDDFPIEQVRQGNRYVEVPPGEHDDGCMVATGWYSAKEHSDYDTLYSALLDSTDELVAWRPVADYPNTSPPPAIDIGKLQAENERLNAIINTPQADDFLRAVSIEAEHQRQRWGCSHDAGKEPADWFWLIGYLAGKALHAHTAENIDKAEHHVITTAAACANWHRAMFGRTDMRPGIHGETALIGDGGRAQA